MTEVPSKVLRLITRLNVGGPARQALMLTHELQSYFPTLLAAGRPSASEGELRDTHIQVRYIPLVRPVRPITDTRALVTTRRLMASLQPAIVHTHMAKAGLIGRSAAISGGHRARLVHTFHGHVLSGYFSKPSTRAFVELERALARRTDVLIAVSTQVRDDLLSMDIGRETQYRVIPVGLDLESYLTIGQAPGSLRTALSVPFDVPLVGVIGRLVAIKDHRTLLDAVAKLPDVHLAVIGDGELRPRLVRQAEQSGVARRVHFAGWWSDIPQALADLDLVALSSRNEGTPVALIEALAAGRAVVATNVGGVSSVVEDGISGYLVPPGDASMLADRIQQLLDDPGLRTKMGAAGRRHVEETFSGRRLVEQIRNLYSELVSG